MVIKDSITKVKDISIDGSVEYSNCDRVWFFINKLHRIDGPVEYSNCDRVWFFENKSHRIGGPAVKNYNGDKEWYF